MEIHLAADGRHAERVAVAADAGNHAGDQMAGFWVIGIAPKRSALMRGDGAGAHGEDVAQNAADAGGGALIGLDEGRMIVAFHLEDDRQSPSPISTTPAFSPGPWMTCGPVVGRVLSHFFEDL